MTRQGNILFIMCDQLRFDYLSCYGHPSLDTPHIDSLADRGVRFTNAYCQAPLCGPSRASFYSGRYQSSHGVMGNADGIGVGEMMLSDYLQPLGYRCAVVGKTDCRKRETDLKRAGVDLESTYAKASQCGGFEPFEGHEGLYPDATLPADNGYTRFLKSRGYPTSNPWDRCANSGVDANGNRHSGWLLRNSKYPAAVDEADSETAFTTQRAMDFIDQTGEQPWCLHLSYIKPHWPLIAPAPYHQRYGKDDLIPANRENAERDNPHPVFDAFLREEYSRSYSREDVRETAIPVYMGLVKQIDDHLGRLFEFLAARDLLETTLIVFTADHGDYLGDHWLGEKDLFHEASVKIPFIVVDPRTQADTTRGTQCDALIESIDLVPSLVEFAGGEFRRERLEGRSLMPLLRADPVSGWRDFCVSETDYSDRGPRRTLGLEPYQCRAIMVRDRRWKYVHHYCFPAQLYDLENDPLERVDLGGENGHGAIHALMQQRTIDFMLSLKRRTGIDYDKAFELGPENNEELGYIIGRW